MGFWLIMLSLDATCGGYLAYLWGRWHAALLQGLPQGIHGQGFLAYLAVVVVLTSLSIWVLCMARELGFKVWMGVLDCLAAGFMGALSDQQRQFAQWAIVAALLTGLLLVFTVPFWLGVWLDQHSRAGSLEVKR